MSLNLKEIKEKKRENPRKLGLLETEKGKRALFPATARDGSGPGKLVDVRRAHYRRHITKGASHAPKRGHVGNSAISCGGMCGSHVHLPATKLSGLGHRRPVHLPVGAMSPHAPSKCVFQNTTLRPCYVFRDALEFLPFFGLKLNPML